MTRGLPGRVGAPRAIAVTAPVIVDRGSSRMRRVSGAVIRPACRLTMAAAMSV